MTDRYVSSAGSNTYAQSISSATPCSFSTAIQFGTGGDRFNVKADGIYARAAVDVFSGMATFDTPIVWRGYLNTTGDGYQGRLLGNGALNTGNFPMITYGGSNGWNNSSGWQIFDSLLISGTRTINSLVTIPLNSAVINCTIINSSAANFAQAVSFGATQQGLLENCDVLMTNSALNIGNAIASIVGTRCINNRIVIYSSGTGACAINSTLGGFIAGNTIIGTSGAGIGILLSSLTTIPTIFSNTIAGFQDGVNVASGSSQSAFILNNLITDNSGYGININSSSGTPTISLYNRFRNNGSGSMSNAGNDWFNSVSYGVLSGGATSDYLGFPFDLRLASTSPAIAAGLPYPASIGALQYTPATGVTSAETSYSFV